MKPVSKLPFRESEQYKTLVGCIIGTYRLAKRIRNARSESVISEYKANGRKALVKIETTFKPGAFPRLDDAVRRLKSAMRNA